MEALLGGSSGNPPFLQIMLEAWHILSGPVLGQWAAVEVAKIAALRGFTRVRGCVRLICIGYRLSGCSVLEQVGCGLLPVAQSDKVSPSTCW